MDELLSTSEVAALLGVTVGHVHKLVQLGTLTPAKRYPRQLLFGRADVERVNAGRQPRGRPRKTPPAEGPSDGD